MTLHAMLSGLISRWEDSLERSLRNVAAERKGEEAARGEFINALIVETGVPMRNPDGRATSRRLGD